MAGGIRLRGAHPQGPPLVWGPSLAFRGPLRTQCFGTHLASGRSIVMKWQSWWAPIMLTSAFKRLVMLLPVKESLGATECSDTIKPSWEASDRLKET